MEIKFCGAAGTVTGSKHLVTCNSFQFLVDCGMVQERDNLDRNWQAFLDSPRRLNAVFLTHAHLDHCGLIPKLFKDGFRGAIYGTPATLDLTRLILMDSAHIQEEDALFKQKRHAREGRRSPRPVRPLYNQSDVGATCKLFQPIRYGKPTKIVNGVQATFHDAGHILGSSFIEFTLSAPQIDQEGAQTLLFSGDLGRANRPIIRDPEFFKENVRVDKLFIESTYGDRISDPIDTVDDQLVAVINRTVERHGKVIMPVFAVERAQEMLCRLARLRDSGQISTQTPIFLDSPMAVEATEIFGRHKDCFDEETLKMIQSARESLHNLSLLRTKEESQQLNDYDGAAIIMASAGMCNAGRIKHHLANHISSAKNSVVFLGYQAEGTLGRQI
ncbi:MAG: MBL fold metallo-hydrolase, partial [Planctomycetia bacterium]|nr:MBL fold metallo-hydrolase [Planctomycetia bacterium]